MDLERGKKFIDFQSKNLKFFGLVVFLSKFTDSSFKISRTFLVFKRGLHLDLSICIFQDLDLAYLVSLIVYFSLGVE